MYVSFIKRFTVLIFKLYGVYYFTSFRLTFIIIAAFNL